MNVAVNPNGNASASTNAAGFDVSLFPMPGIFRGLAEQSTEQVRENYEKMRIASGQIADNLREVYASHAKGAADYGSKVLEISGINTQSAFNFLTSLMATRSLSDIMNISATQSRKNLEVASTQSRELWELLQKSAAETTEPIKNSLTKVLQPVS